MTRPIDPNEAGSRDRRLRELVAHAYAEVPFYRERFDAAGVRPADIRGIADLSRLPFVVKADLLERPLEDLVARGTDPTLLVSTMTSGYSGEPLVVHRTRAEQSAWARSWLRDLLDAGLRRDDRVASVFVQREGGPDGIALLSSLGLVHERMIDCVLEPEEILGTLRRERPTFLRGLPSVLERVAARVTPGDREHLRPRVVWLSGEVVTPGTRARIEAAFGAPVHDAYGTHEVGLVASDCRATGLMHLGRPDLVVEVVAPARQPAPTGTDEIAVTALDFRTAPFLRYRLSDSVTAGPDGCLCGRPGPTLARIEGRTLDYFDLPDGRAVHPYRLLGPLLQAAPWIRQYQLVQSAPDRIVLRHVARAGADPDAAHDLARVVAAELGPGVRFEVEAVSRIPTAAGGKPRPIVTLARDRLARRP